MKKIICIFLCLTLLCFIPFKAYGYSAKSMVLLEHSTHTVINSVDCHKKMPMASTTKIMTALIVLENADLSEKVVVPKSACGVEGSSMYLVEGETLTVADLLYGLMLTSGNDAATALAIAVCGSENAFVDLMNKKAEELGLLSTHFTNPSGLPDDNHYTTAYELALITSAALQNDIFSQIVSTKSIRVPYKNNPNGRLLKNHNKLLSLYEYAIGVKTGFTKKAGRCLVSAAKKDGVILICVTLNAPDDWNDHIVAFDEGFTKMKNITLAEIGELKVWLSTPDGKKILATNPSEIKSVSIEGNLFVQTVFAESFLYPPKAKGQVVGNVIYSINGKTVAASPLCLQNSLDITIKKEIFIIKLIKYIKGLFK